MVSPVLDAGTASVNKRSKKYDLRGASLNSQNQNKSVVHGGEEFSEERKENGEWKNQVV